MIQTPLKSQTEPRFNQEDQSSDDPSAYITVTCRLKPLSPNEEKSIIQVDKNLHQITLNDPTKSISKTYTFDRVYDETASQDDFANHICDPLMKFLKNGGESGLIFSYGITNSGKTYTILGTNEEPGILFTLIRKLQEQFPKETLRIVACELYKEDFLSLKVKGQRLQPKEFKGTISFDDCESDEINQSNMKQLFENYLQNRSCAATNFNALSSRSHAIFKITSKSFKIGIVDLAGSERTKKQNDEIQTDMKETIFINKSLLTLRKCIKALEDRQANTSKVMVPYRESKLTQALVEYFIQNSKINIIVNVNQAKHCLELNLNAMDYTSKAKDIKANVTNDFTKMMKILTSKKKNETSMFKSKVGKELKRYSDRILSQDKYIINEEMLDADELEFAEEIQREKKQRRSEIMRQQNEQMYNDLIEEPDVIEEFIEKQRLYREIYLSTDLVIEKEMDERKLSALRKVNLMETTEKKEKPKEPELQIVNAIETEEFGTQILPGELIDENDEIEEKLAKIQFLKLRTAVKSRLMPLLDEEKRKKLVEAETMWSERKCENLEKVDIEKIETVNEEEEQSNYTTPNKKNEKVTRICLKTKSIVKKSEGKGIFKSIAKGVQSSFNGIKSCVKSGAKFISGFGKSSFKTKNQAINSLPQRKLNLQAQTIFNVLIRPDSKFIYESKVQNQVDITRSSKKIKILEPQPQHSSDGQIEMDLPPILVEKEVEIQTFEIGIQTDKMELTSTLQVSIDQNLADQKIKNQKDRKQRKQKGFSSYSEDSTVVQENETSETETPEKKENNEKKTKPTSFENPKTAFKNLSMNKNKGVKVCLKKHNAMVSNAKSAVAKHTRGAQRKKDNYNKAEPRKNEERIT